MNALAALEAEPPCLGQVTLSFDGQLDGWCYYPYRPTERAIIEVVIRGVVVRAAVAAQPRPDLRMLGKGDGYCGFLLALPQGAFPEGGPGIIEVRERRNRQLIGRIVSGADQALVSEKARLNAEAAALSSAHQNLDRLVANEPIQFATHFSRLGAALRAHAPGRPWNPVLAASQAFCNTIPHTDLGYVSHPKVTLIISASPCLRDTAARLREAALCLRPTRAEFILLYADAQPMAALLPTRMRNLHLVRVDHYTNLAIALNEAALQARGEWLGFLASDHLIPAGLAQACRAAISPTVYAADTFLTHLQTHPAIITGLPPTPPPFGGLSCLLTRDAFLALEGLDVSLTEQAMWMYFLEKAACILPIQPWSQRRHFSTV